MLASSYPLLDIFFSIFFFFIFFLWIFLLIQILIDIFRSHDMNGWVKALWVLFLIILPFLGVLVYLIARGGKMQERAVKDQKAQQDAFASYVKETAGTSADNTADQLAKLADLKTKGVITDAEFDAQKAKLLG